MGEINVLLAKFIGWQYIKNDLAFHSVFNNKENISYFSGFVKSDVPYTECVPIIVVKENKLIHEHKRLKQMDFKNDLNILFQVVNKIESLVNDKGDNYRFHIHNETAYIENTNFISSANCESKNIAIYNVCVDFVKDYYNYKD